ncbi:hypothetical protein SELMODRAFT_416710 [Selaginella moellendorffii]|uniref:Uncharacterized protein n=1 Tax=Selaginella moellendorffii TaxID=88036 RepID=D8S061_SELML|nr:hypothetical protein SELMODRAFT_416710 [Selaginella moellendorffii]
MPIAQRLRITKSDTSDQIALFDHGGDNGGRRRSFDYTSLSDLMSSRVKKQQSEHQSLKNPSPRIPIKNRLVEQAAKAYLRPSSPPTATARNSAKCSPSSCAWRSYIRIPFDACRALFVWLDLRNLFRPLKWQAFATTRMR